MNDWGARCLEYALRGIYRCIRGSWNSGEVLSNNLARPEQ